LKWLHESVFAFPEGNGESNAGLPDRYLSECERRDAGRDSHFDGSTAEHAAEVAVSEYAGRAERVEVAFSEAVTPRPSLSIADDILRARKEFEILIANLKDAPGLNLGNMVFPDGHKIDLRDLAWEIRETARTKSKKRIAPQPF
jgi:hypothetical protein